MKITEIKSYLLTAPRDLHVVKMETDAGIYGLGEAGCSTREYAQEGALRHFRRFLVGMDPMRIEHIWQVLYRSAYYEGGRILTAAISAVDMALYDILGKALGVPVYQLLGGACRDRVYGFRTVGAVSQPDCLEKANAAIEEGWPALRFEPADPVALGCFRPAPAPPILPRFSIPGQPSQRRPIGSRNFKAGWTGGFRWGSISITACPWPKRRRSASVSLREAWPFWRSRSAAKTPTPTPCSGR